MRKEKPSLRFSLSNDMKSNYRGKFFSIKVGLNLETLLKIIADGIMLFVSENL